MIVPFVPPEQRDIDEMTPDEQRQLLETFLADEDSFSIVLDENGNEVPPGVPLGGNNGGKRRKRQRKVTNGAYVTCKWLAEKVGCHEDTIRKRFRQEKGVDKRTFSGRNRKTYTVLRISKTAAKRMFPELELE